MLKPKSPEEFSKIFLKFSKNSLGDLGFNFFDKNLVFFSFFKIEIQKSVKHDFCRDKSAPKMAIFHVLKGGTHKLKFSAKNLLQLLSHFFKNSQAILASPRF